ncbi:hypothetical protein GCM10007857_77010 [Bradyrhizobium iriomotense]|uniref:Uncharacterized protein n=1 Tax=Bradyrhizobium iriomotense TaxID=441950 RepID=A0ABQ6BDJ2_9BRAD|nr:hypothetical protein GCM10007857_77010 [Bradyrhizobium iriomotense]
MEPLDLADLPEDRLVSIDWGTYHLFPGEASEICTTPQAAVEGHGTRRLRFAVTTITIAEILSEPLHADDAALARRYREFLHSCNRKAPRDYVRRHA